MRFEPGQSGSRDLLLTSTFYHLAVNSSSKSEKNVENFTGFYCFLPTYNSGCLDGVPRNFVEVTVFQKRITMRTNIN